MPGILVFDLATVTGGAHSARLPSGRPESWVWRIKDQESAAYETAREQFCRSDHHRKLLNTSGAFLSAAEELIWGAVDQTKPDLIVYEAPIIHENTFPDVAFKLFGLAGICDIIGWRLGIPTARANIMTVKKFFTGSGRAQKIDMINACRDRGWNISDHNEADAIAVLCWAEDFFLSKRDYGLLFEAVSEPSPASKQPAPAVDYKDFI